MNESVYSLIPPTPVAKSAPPMYKSSHRNLAPTHSTFGLHGTSKVVGNVAGVHTGDPEVHPSVKSTGSFGKSVSATINPKDFLKKTAGEAASTKHGATYTRSKPANPKPAIPTKEDRPVMGLKTDKNFVVANAVESVLTAPKRQTVDQERAVDKQNFGQVPGYLSRIQAELKSKSANAAASQMPAQEEFDIMSADEVENLRLGLEARLEALNKQYQTLSFTLETGSQKKRKEVLEKSMADIEVMLKKLQKRRVIVVDQ